MSNEESIEIIVQAVIPYLTTLSDTSTRDRPAKRRAIDAVKKELAQIKTWSTAPTVASEILAQLIDSLLVCTESGIESVREHAVSILNSLVSTSLQISCTVTEKLLKNMMNRLKQEDTEEIRVAWMDLCVTYMSKWTDSKISATQAELIMNIMQVAGRDPFSEVLHRVAKLIILFAQLQPKSTDYACDRMIRLCIPLLLHKHTAVRVLGIKAMEEVLIVSPKGLHLLYQEEEHHAIVPTLIYDSSPFVRDNLFTSLGKLLCHWSPRDRYQYGEKILPIILAGTLDELPSIQTTCKQCLNQVGQSCTQDLFEADIIQEIPTNDEISENTGLKHLVHMCFDKSLIQILDASCTDFIITRQTTSLDSLRLFLSYANENDLVKQIKRLINALLVIYINKREEPIIVERVWEIIALLQTKLPSVDIYLDVLISRLDNKYLLAETIGFPGALTVLAVTTFLYQFISIASNNSSFKQRVLVALQKPYLKQYIVEYQETTVQIEKINTLLSS